MITIDRATFLYILRLDDNFLIENKIPKIDFDSVEEFPLGKNYFYKINDNRHLISIQRRLNTFLRINIPLNNAATAFKRGSSYLNFLEPHKENYHFLRLDIRSFFHSIQVEDIKNIFAPYFKNDYIDPESTQSLLDGFINLITLKLPDDIQNTKIKGQVILPMGFITSPIISNIIFRQLDIQIQKLCADKGLLYTRYADDMLFSSAKGFTYIHSIDFTKEISIILSKMNFQLNTKKSVQANHTISLNGYVIQNEVKTKNVFSLITLQNEVRISNKKTNIIEKLLYMYTIKKISAPIILNKLFNYRLNPSKFEYKNIKNDTLTKYYNDQFLNKITGYRSYLISIINFNKKFNCTSEATIAKYSKIVEELNKIIKTFSS